MLTLTGSATPDTFLVKKETMGRPSNPTSGFGGLVRRLRLEADLTQAELADAAGMTPGYLAKIELGQAPSASAAMLKRLARALGVKESALLKEGSLPARIEKAYRETPQELIWFASLPKRERRRLASTDDDAAADRERKRQKRLANRLSRGES